MPGSASPSARRQPALGLIEPVQTPERFSVDNDVRRTEYAARDGFVTIGKALIKSGARVDGVDSEGQTALMWAVREGETEYAEMLLVAGADPEHRDRHGDTALDIARRINHGDLVTLLGIHATRDHQTGLPR